MRDLRKTGVFSIALSVILLLPMLGQAAVLEEIIVTAQKRSESANDVGMAVQAISGSDLADQRIVDTADLASVVPGFSFSETGIGTPIYTLRGVGFTDSSVQSTSTVGVYVDEVAIPYPIMTRGDLLDVERVEVLKGPQGTLYGRNSTGGAINYIANKPGEEFEGSITAGYGRFETTEISGFVSVPISDSAGIRVAGKTTQSGEGWQKSVSSGAKLGEKDRSSLRAILDLAPTDGLQITFTAGWWNDKSDTQAAQAIDFVFQDPANTPVADTIVANSTLSIGNDSRDADWTQNTSIFDFRNDVRSTSLSAAVKWDLSDSVLLTSLTSYSELKDDSTFSEDGLAGVPTAAIGYLSTVPGAAPTDNQANYVVSNNADIEAFSQELRFSGEATNMNWIAGLYYATDDIVSRRPAFSEYTTNTDFTPTLGFDNFENRSDVDSELYAIFTHIEWTLTDALRLTTGLRYTEEKKDYQGCSADTGVGDIAPFFGALPGECISLDESFIPGLVTDRLKEDSVSGRIGLDYIISNDHLAYFSYSRGFKAGGFPTLDASAQAQFAPVEQEQLDALEIGIKSTLAGGAAQLNVGAFYYDYTDKQLGGNVVDPVFGILGRLVNAPESEVTGVEVELQWQLSDAWYVSGSGAYVDTEVTKFVGIDNLGNTVDFKGSEFPNAPKTTANALVAYETEFNSTLRAGFSVDASYQSKMKSAFSSDPRFTIDSYTIVNARAFIGGIDDSWRVNLWVRNLNDKFYLTNIGNVVDTLTQYSRMPRTYGVDFTYNF